MKVPAVKRKMPWGEIWINPTLESLMSEECLCFHCGNFKPDQPEEHCRKAAAFFALCRLTDTTFPMAGCSTYVAKSA